MQFKDAEKRRKLFSMDSELLDWIGKNYEAIDALLSGRAAVVPYKAADDRNGSGMAWRQFYREIDNCRLDKPTVTSEGE